MQRADYVIVGAGSAGCVLANRLSADPRTSVIVVEAGGEVRSLYSTMPAGFAYAIKNSSYNWNYKAEPEPGLNNRAINCSRGRGLGGSSAINALAFTRGLKSDFDAWESLLGQEWGHESCFRDFVQIEEYKGVASPFRGKEGPLRVLRPSYSTPLYEKFLDACVQAGHSTAVDPNATMGAGFGPMDQTIYNGSRDSAATAFLRPARRRKNLTVVKHATATKIVFNGLEAIGVEVLHGGVRKTILASREVIISAGAIKSPQLLMLSGIGDSAHLHDVGITPILNLPGVGRNLQDHVDVSIRHTCTEAISETPLLNPLRKMLIGIEWLLTRQGAGATNHFELGGFLTASSGDKPDAHVVFIPMLVGPDGRALRNEHGFQATIMVSKPRSRGSIELRDADPMAAPRIRFNALSASQDRDVLIAGIRQLRKIYRMPAIAHLCKEEIAPGPGFDDDQKLGEYIADNAKSTNHASGTCAMGHDASAVTDGGGKVHGTKNLRVVDASIIPIIPSVNINATVLMLANKLARKIIN